MTLRKSVIVGSPPPMRGKVESPAGGWKTLRITPAYAGKRFGTDAAHRPCQDHPRLCGEKFNPWLMAVCRLGSPPPMRGKVVDSEVSLRCHGITPAYAGKRQYLHQRTAASGDHPRLCGEKELCYDSTRPCLGSPPPMRGKDFLGMKSEKFNGITPAYAGKSSCKVACKIAGRGSPPPMRGKALVRQFLVFYCRITPAYAGKSRQATAKLRISRDHPRLCGEKLFLRRYGRQAVGSPPPMRGKAQRATLNRKRTRITPAYAGKSFSAPEV